MNRLSAHYKGVLKSSAHALPAALALFLVSCTSTSTSLEVASAGLQPSLTAPMTSTQAQTPQAAANGTIPIPAAQTAVTANLQQPDANLAAPTGVKIVENPAPAQLDQNSKLVAAAAAAAANNSQNATTPAATSPATPAATADAAPAASTQVAAAQPTETAPPAANPTLETSVAPVQSSETVPVTNDPNAKKTPVMTATPPAQQILTAAPLDPAPPLAPPKKKSLFDTLFASNKKPATQNTGEAEAEPVTKLALASPTPPTPRAAKVAVEPVLQPAKLDLSNLEQPQSSAADEASAVDNGELPGVRKGALFEIKRRDSLQDDTDVDIGETDHGPVLLASAAGLARLAPNGLKVQRESVDVACLKPQLVKMLKRIESHYGSSVVVTSGYRSPGYNRRVRGAKNSLHMFCAAADIQVVGVSKWELARYARSMPGRGGVGTYCHTDSVHIDVGPDRDWNWRCSRRK